MRYENWQSDTEDDDDVDDVIPKLPKVKPQTRQNHNDVTLVGKSEPV